MAAGSLSFLDLSPTMGSFRDDVLRGLAQRPKALAPKYFYDAVGSALFDAICALEEYYPTRTETALLLAHGSEIAQHMGSACALIEFGSGMSRKSRILIAQSRPSVYVPIDIARETLRAAAENLRHTDPQLNVVAVCGDYSTPLALPSLAQFEAGRRVIFFPGSTIGNFDPAEAIAFLKNAAQIAGPGGGLVIGVDLKKAKRTLDLAYDDPQGVTAAFNLNLLARINRELHANFDVRAFRHRAHYVEGQGRVEMHLESLRAQSVAIGNRKFDFERGETIHTENSYKYTLDVFSALAERAGFVARRSWVDANRLFSIHYMERWVETTIGARSGNDHGEQRERC
jgi:dimethylhistidine N-methyltransferase